MSDPALAEWPPKGVKWYYSDNAVAIAHGDCREILPLLPKVDLILTDPPYGIGFVHGDGGGCLARSTEFNRVKVVGDDKPFDPTSLLPFQNLVLWGANHYASRLPDSPCWLVWDKREGMCQNDQADCELAWTSLTSPARIKRHYWNGMLKASERGERRLHPTQKPVQLMTWCLEFFPDARIVMDPFMGSGTTLVAAKSLGRRAIGIEIEERYCDIAASRLSQEYLYLSFNGSKILRDEKTPAYGGNETQDFFVQQGTTSNHDGTA